jgi:L-threonylcarbamoyladenylate synthase
MQTLVLSIDPVSPQPDRIEQAAALLRQGELVAFPTETVYGLGANALDRTAVAGIFLAKGRPSQNPVIVHLADVYEVGRVCASWPPVAGLLAQRFWPGPLTLILPRLAAVPNTVTGGGATVAVRIPSHPVAHALILAAGVPLAAPSANRSTELSPTRAEHVRRSLDGRIPLILDGGPTPGGIESTVLDVTSQPPRLLRPGLVSQAEIEAVIGPILLSTADPGGTVPLRSPGLLARHYAPRTPLECVADGASRARALAEGGFRVGLVAMADGRDDFSWPGVRVLTLPADPAGYASQLYAALHVLDDAALERLVLTLPPDAPEWHAVHDRLRRASA